MLQEVLYRDGVDIQNSLSVSLTREICQQLETLQNFFKSRLYVDGIKFEPWISKSFLFDMNFTEDGNQAKDRLNDYRAKKLQLEFKQKPWRIIEFLEISLILAL
jgi:hypothetical protein